MEAVEEILSEDGTPGNLAISRGPGRPPFQVTDENRDLVSALTINGVTQDEIAETLGISTPTLTKYFGEELTHGKRLAVAKVAKSLYRAALKADQGEKGAVTAAIFFLKTQGRWREEDKQAPSVTVNILTVQEKLRQIPTEELRITRQLLLEAENGEGEE